MINIILKKIILNFLFIIVILILFLFLTLYMSIKPGKWSVHFTPESFNLKYENVTFKTSDGLRNSTIPTNYELFRITNIRN